MKKRREILPGGGFRWIRSLKESRYYLIVLLALSSGLYLNAHVSSQTPTGQNASHADKVRVSNVAIRTNVSGFAVASVQETRADTIRLTLRNDYPKAITAFSIEFGRHHSRIDSIDTDEVIQPGSTIEHDVAVPVLKTASPGSKTVVAVAAVVFEGGLGEGNAQHIREILDYRLGQKQQIARIIRVLTECVKAYSSGGALNLRAARKRISLLPDTSSGAPFDLIAGLRDERQIALEKIDELEVISRERGEQTALTVLERFRSRYDRKLRKL